MLSLFSKHVNKNHIGLYRDDDLAILKNTSGQAAEKFRKKFQKLFNEKDLHIIDQFNLKITNYLDITISLKNGYPIPPLQKTQRRNQPFSRQFRPPSINY